MIIIDILLGCLLGIILGLIPNIHINIGSYVFLAVGLFTIFPDKFYLFLSIAIAQLITSYIPTTMFGVPNTENIMFIFPAQRYFAKGEAKQAIFLSLLGSLFGAVSAIILLPLLYLLFSVLFNFHIFIYLAITFVLLFFIFQEENIKQKLVVLSIIILSGLLGVLTLKFNYFYKDPLIICVTGLFALPMLIRSLFDKTQVIKQKTTITSFPKLKGVILSFFGALSSLLIILIPSFSSSQAATIVSVINQKLKQSEYLVIFSSISISALIFSFFLAINFFKPRLGYIAILLVEKQIPQNINYFVFIVCILLSCALTILVILLIINFIINFINRTNLRILNIFVLVITIGIVMYISNFKPILLLVVSTMIGYLPIQFNKSRVILMAYIMVPTILFYI